MTEDFALARPILSGILIVVVMLVVAFAVVPWIGPLILAYWDWCAEVQRRWRKKP